MEAIVTTAHHLTIITCLVHHDLKQIHTAAAVIVCYFAVWCFSYLSITGSITTGVQTGIPVLFVFNHMYCMYDWINEGKRCGRVLPQSERGVDLRAHKRQET